MNISEEILLNREKKNQLFIILYCLKQLLIPAIITVHLAPTRKYQYHNGYYHIDIVCKVDEGENLIKIHSSDKYHIQTKIIRFEALEYVTTRIFSKYMSNCHVYRKPSLFVHHSAVQM